MTQLSQGFYLEQIAVVGSGVDPAEVQFSDGLNIVEGASDTGKSYLFSLVDFVFGASRAPRKITQAKGYARVIARLRDRRTGNLHEIERAINGGDTTVRKMDSQGAVLEERAATAKHSAEDTTTLSALLLELSGFGLVKVRKNKKGEMRTLSFRDIAYLVVVDETRIISENPPHLSDNRVERTVEGDVFRFLVTGEQSVEPIVALRKTTTQSAKAQLELVLQLISQIEGEVEQIQLGSSPVEEELNQIDQASADLLQAYESSRIELVNLERELTTQTRLLREAESRLLVVNGLIKRFELLDRHYKSNVDRLSAIEEAGSMLEALPAKVCPVCGAPPEKHQPEQAAEHFRVEDVRQAAVTERQKIGQLLVDLQQEFVELNQERDKLEEQRVIFQEEVRQIQDQVSNEVRPRVRTSAEQLQVQTTRRNMLLRGRVLTEQLNELRIRASQLESQSKKVNDSAPVVKSEATTASMEEFAQQVQEILTAWQFPETGRVVFSEESQDLVVGDQPRVSHGKGVRALTCSAFITGLMRHCLQKGLAHPGLVVLDSPLVAYKDPESGSLESVRIREAGVRDAFYRALAGGLCLGQVIILENQEPPTDVSQRVTHYHFTKGPNGRYGFYPVIA